MTFGLISVKNLHVYIEEHYIHFMFLFDLVITPLVFVGLFS